MIHVALPDTFQLQCVLARFSPAQLMDLVHALLWKLKKKKKKSHKESEYVNVKSMLM